MSEYEQVIDEIVKHGVVVKVNKIVDDNYINHERKYVGCVVELDFSEHNKVFEDKIADLEKRIRELIKEKDEYKRKCNDFGFENQDLKKIIKDYEDKIATLEEKLLTSANAVEQNRRRSFVLEMKNQELKQITKGYEDKIAELKKDYKTASELLGKYQQENEALKKRVVELEAELEGKERPLRTEIDTSTPLDCANSLIHHLTHLDAFLIAPERDVQTFTLDDLEQIAEHLLVYCKHNKESEE